ncbi:MAG: hypothetical protein ACX94C_01000 [Phycisphaerales bacterium]
MHTRFVAIIALFIASTPACAQIITEDLVLTPPDPDKNIYYGSSVTLADDFLAICAFGAERAPDRAGVVYLYDTDSFKLIRKIRPPKSSGDTFARDVQISNGRIAISAYRPSEFPDYEHSIYVFDIQTGALLSHISNPEHDAPGETYFAIRFALGPDTLAVGDFIDDEFGGYAGGAVFLFNPNTGDLIEKFAPDDTNTTDTFGQNLCFDNDQLIVTSRASAANTDTWGTAFIYDLNPRQETARLPLHDELNYVSGLIDINAQDGKILLGNTDRRQLRLLDTTNQHPPITMVPQNSTPMDDEFPSSLAYAPPFAVAMGYFDSSVIHACLFDTTTGDQIARLGPSTSYFGSQFPNALAMDDRFIAIGEPTQRANGSRNVGAVYIYDLDTFAWPLTLPGAMQMRSPATPRP